MISHLIRRSRRVRNRSNRWTGSNRWTFGTPHLEDRIVPTPVLTAGTPFDSKLTTPAPTSWALAVGDLNGDGKQDFVSHGGVGSSQLAIFLGDGNKGFTSAGTLTFKAPVIIQPNSVVLADLVDSSGFGEPDGFDDLAFIEPIFQNVVILPSNGKGDFGLPVLVATANTRISMSAGDFNQDGRMDLLLGRTGGGGPGGTAGEYEVLLNNGDGTFKALQRTHTNNMDKLAAMPLVTDLNGDGREDFVAINQTAVGGLGRGGVYFGAGDGTFSSGAALKTPTATPPDTFTVGDFNGDGLKDVALFVGTQVHIYLQSSPGMFPATPTSSFSTELPTVKAVSTDLDFDGFDDLILSTNDSASPGLRFYAGSSSGKFTSGPGLLIATEAASSALTIIDGNFNGTPDLITGLSYSTPAAFNFQYFNNDLLPTGPINSKVRVSVAPNPVAYGSNVTFVGTVSRFGNPPTGDMTILVDGKAIGSGAIDSSGKFSITTPGSPFFPVGIRSVQAVYGGDTQYLAKNSPVVNLTVEPLFSDLSLTFTSLLPPLPPFFPNALSIYGADVTIEAAITPVGKFVPSGKFQFFADTQSLGFVSVDADGKAKLVTPIISAGENRQLKAVYTADPIYSNGGVVLAADLLDVLRLDTELDIISSSNPSVFGEPVTYTVQIRPDPGFSAFVNPVYEGRSVVILDNDNVIASLFFDKLGFASFTVPPDYALGQHGIQAVFPGDNDLNGSSSALFIQTVNKANSQVLLTPSKSAIIFGDSVTLTAEVSIVAPGVGFPSGTVTFFQNGLPIGSRATDGNGKAFLEISGLPTGKFNFTASFSGNVSVNGSKSSVATVEVNPTISQLTFTVSPADSTLGTPVLLEAKVTNSQGLPVNVGKVVFSGNFNGLPIQEFVPPGQLTVPVAGGQAITVVNGLPFGTGALTATFLGDSSITDSAAGPVAISVSKAVAAVFLTTEGSTAQPLGKAVPLRVTLQPPPGVPFPITGTVAFFDNGVQFATVPVENFTASTTRTPTLGFHTITAEYSGDANYAPVSPVPLELNIFRPNDRFSVGAGAGGPDRVNVYDSNGSVVFSPLFAFSPDHTAGVRVATADFNGDGVQDVVMGTGPGTGSRVRILSGVDGTPLADFSPFGMEFTGGVFVAVGDVNGDFRPDLVVTPDKRGGPRVRVYNGTNFATMADFFGVLDANGVPDVNFRGGARAAVGDINADGFGDLVVSAGFGGGPRIAVFNGKSLGLNGGPKLAGDFFAFESTLRNGTFVAAGDIDGDGFADIAAGAGPGGGPRVTIFSGKAYLSGQLVKIADFFAGNVNSRTGVPVALRFLDGDDRFDLLAGTGGGGDRVTAYSGISLLGAFTPPNPILAFDAFSKTPNPEDAFRGTFVG